MKVFSQLANPYRLVAILVESLRSLVLVHKVLFCTLMLTQYITYICLFLKKNLSFLPLQVTHKSPFIDVVRKP
jgi:hypothetical protein